jgi:hypothetical protein
MVGGEKIKTMIKFLERLYGFSAGSDEAIKYFSTIERP